MSLRFSYWPFSVHSPVYTLHGRNDRPRPVIAVTIIGPTGDWVYDSLLDTGSDDTIFPESAAARIGLDLTNVPTGSASGVGMAGSVVRFAEVTLRIADHHEQREWPARVGFTPVKLRQPLLGYAGFLRFFTATFHGDLEEVELTVNGKYAGR